MFRTFLAWLVLSGVALAQQPVQQSGNVTPGHAATWTTNGVIQDGGTSASPNNTSLGAVGQGSIICANSAPVTLPYYRLCLDASDGLITYDALGGASAQNFSFTINGIAGIPFSSLTPIGAGTFLGNPTAGAATPTSFPVSGLTANVAPDANQDYLVLWNHTTGAFQKINPGTIASSATSGVSSLGGMTGALTCGTGLLCVGSTASLASNGVSVSTQYPNVTASNANTTGTITASSATLTLANASDFANGQGIRINHAGAAATMTGVSGQGATPCLGAIVVNCASGSTTYTYAVACIDAFGGASIYGATFSTSTGPATLSLTNYIGVSWNTCSGSGTAGYAIYGRSGAAGSLQLLGFATSSPWYDIGSAPPGAPDWLPQTGPSNVALADWLVTSISSGAGTTTLTLANAATTSAVAQFTTHDTTVALNNWMNAAAGTRNQEAYLAPGNYLITSPLSVSGPVSFTLRGAGNIASTITNNSAAQDVLQIGATGRVLIHDIGLQGSLPNTVSASSGLNFNGPQFGTIGAVIDNVFISQIANGITGTGLATSVISKMYISNTDGIGLNLQDFVDGTIADSLLTPIGVNKAQAIFLNGNPGGTRIINNKINGALFSTGISIRFDRPDADILVTGNSIEGVNTGGYGMLLSRTAGATVFNNIIITGNEFGSPGNGIINVSPDAGWLGHLLITGNVIFLATAGQTGINTGGVTNATITGNDISALALLNGTGINVPNAANFTITGNIINNLSQGISIGAASTHCMINPNVFTGTTTQITDSSAACTYGSITTTKPTYP